MTTSPILRSGTEASAPVDVTVAPVPAPHSRRGDIVFAFSVILCIYVAWLIRDVLLLLYVSALFAVVLMPVVRGLMRIRIGSWQPGRAVAIVFLFLVVGGALTLFVTFALPPVANDMQSFIHELPTRGPQMLSRLHQLPFASRIDFSGLNSKLQDIVSTSAKYIFLSLGNWATRLFDIVTGIVLTVYFMLEGEHAYAWVLSFIPPLPRRRLDSALQRAELRMGKWLLGQGSLMLILGTLSTIVFLSLHVRYAYALGVLAGMFNLIPVAGAAISIALALVVAAVDSWGRFFGVLIFYAIYQQLENSYLTPRIMKSSVDLPGLAIMVSLLLGAALQGIVGAMISVPTAVLVAVLLDEYAVYREPHYG